MIKQTFSNLYIFKYVWSINILSKIVYFERTLIKKNLKNKKILENVIWKKKTNFERTLFDQTTLSLKTTGVIWDNYIKMFFGTHFLNDNTCPHYFICLKALFTIFRMLIFLVNITFRCWYNFKLRRYKDQSGLCRFHPTKWKPIFDFFEEKNEASAQAWRRGQRKEFQAAKRKLWLLEGVEPSTSNLN